MRSWRATSRAPRPCRWRAPGTTGCSRACRSPRSPCARRAGGLRRAWRRSPCGRRRCRGGSPSICSRFSPVAPRFGDRLVEVGAELALEHAVHAADLLLLAQLRAVFRDARRLGAVLAGARVELALGVERAARALQEEVGAFPRARACTWVRYNVPRCSPNLCTWGCPRMRQPGRVTCGGAWADGSRCAAPASRRRSRRSSAPARSARAPRTRGPGRGP